jgi:hypothetical protein
MGSMASTSMSLEVLLEDARKRIEVTEDELDEAKLRRSAIAAALRHEFPGSRIYHNGSVAHGDALTPLTDVDTGVVVSGVEEMHGPGLLGPRGLIDRAADAIRRDLKDKYPKLVVIVEGRKRSILVRFGDPVTPGQADFTADVIVAVDNTSAAGLYIPRYGGWDRSHPEKHTELVHQAIKDTKITYARIIRLLKHWNRTHGKPLCSWNIKALALDCLTEPTTLVDGLHLWFTYAEQELAVAETEDPAHVAPKPIKMNKTKTEVIRALKAAQSHLERAIELEQDSYSVLAHDELAKLFHDECMLPAPGRIAIEAELRRMTMDRATEKDQHGKSSSISSRGLGIGAMKPPIAVRSWAP